MTGIAMTITAASDGSHTLLLRVRGEFTSRGTSLAAWCREFGVDHAHAHRVLRGKTNGDRAKVLRKIIVDASLGRTA